MKDKLCTYRTKQEKNIAMVLIFFPSVLFKLEVLLNQILHVQYGNFVESHLKLKSVITCKRWVI